MYTPPVAPRHERAEPLPPDDRRRAIIEAVIPLFLEKGPTVTTREMAEAAGIAEGTIFGVFPDKPSVVHEAVKVSMDPAPIQRAIDEIPASAPLNTQLEAAARILLERNERVATLIGMLRSVGNPADGPPSGARQFVMDSNTAVLDALTTLFDRHRDALRVDSYRAAIAFRSSVFANAHPLVPPDERPSAQEIVDVTVHGIARPGRDTTN